MIFFLNQEFWEVVILFYICCNNFQIKSANNAVIVKLKNSCCLCKAAIAKLKWLQIAACIKQQLSN